jgi:hypothetical protein
MREEPSMSDNKENIKLLATVIGTLCLVIIVPMFGWAMKSFIDFAKETEGRLAVLEFNAGQGTRYTLEMAERDFIPIVEKVNDHELRVRFLESSLRD